MSRFTPESFPGRAVEPGSDLINQAVEGLASGLRATPEIANTFNQIVRILEGESDIMDVLHSAVDAARPVNGRPHSANRTRARGAERDEQGLRNDRLRPDEHGLMSLEDIRNARGLVKGFRETSISQTTKERYGELSQRLKETGKKPEEIAGTKKAFYSYRAAEVYRHKVLLKTALRDRDRSYRAKDRQAMKEAEERVRESIKFFARYQPGSTREENLQRRPVFKNADGSRSNEKRTSISALPNEWRDRVWNSLSERDRSTVAITALTGIRPSELRKGVQLMRTSEGVEFRIRGSKIDNARGKGQPVRKIQMSVSELNKSIEGQYILSEKCGKTVQLIGTEKAFTARIARAGRRALPDAKSLISPYTYRHAFSARLKSQGRSPEEIAQAMGHQSERSQHEYGRRSEARSSGAGGISAASASKRVRSRGK